MSYMRRSDDYNPGLGKRTAQGAFIGAIPAIATGNPAWLGYGAAAGLGLGLLEGKNALGGGKKRRITKKQKSRFFKSRKSRYRTKSRSPKRY